MASTVRPMSGFRARDLSAPWRHVDWVLLGLTLVLAFVGNALVWSATHRRADLAGRHAVFVVLGIGLMAALAFFDYRKLRDWWWLAYLGGVSALLLALSPLGVTLKGNGGWIALGPIQLQPTEFAKLATIIGLAGYLAASSGDDRPVRRLMIALGLVGVPLGLVLAQPDLGSALVFLAIALGMLLVGGIRLRYLLVLGLIGIVGVVGVLNSGVLSPYQEARLTAFINPDGPAVQGGTDPRYNLRQARIAISTGGFTGYGFGNGPQTRNNFVPAQHTDFIFSVAGEELGFIGAGGLVVMLGAVCWRIWRTAQLAADDEGRLLCVGVLAMIVFHVLENVGMNLGIMPITGIPLPFISYGGSNLLTMFMAVGIVQSVHMRRFA